MNDEIVLDGDKIEVWIDGEFIGRYPKLKVSLKTADAISVIMHDVFDAGKKLKALELAEYLRGIDSLLFNR